MNITRRKFFFFGLAAGVGLFLPDSKIEWVWDRTSYDVYDTREDMIKMIKILEQDKKDNPNWYFSIPYHQSNATTHEWLGIVRK